MPELPEVQTTVDDLNKKVVGRKVVAVWYDWLKLKAVEKTVGFKINNVKRVGKNILIYLSSHLERSQVKLVEAKGSLKDSFLDNGRVQNDSLYILLIHQKMTGHVLVGKWKIDGKKVTPISPETLHQKVNGYIHFILTLDDKKMIALSDLRKFAKVVFGPIEEVEKLPELKKLAPDPLSKDFNIEGFYRKVKSKKKTIYQVLMDQEVVAGIGNIYANDVLWLSRIYPFKIASKLKNEELKKLKDNIIFILKKALDLRGTSSSDYRDTAGEPGGYGSHKLVYDREDLPCFECGTRIKRVKKGGRSAYFCAKCQRV